MELQRNLGRLRRQGLGVAAIGSDSREVMRAFATEHGITYPLLSDPERAVFKRYNLISAKPTGRGVGDLFLYPATIILSAKGEVTARYFEQPYQIRQTVASQLAGVGRPGQVETGETLETPHVTVVASTSDKVVSPGTRFALLVDVFPKPRVHVLAPGSESSRGIVVSVEPDDRFLTRSPIYPPSESYRPRPLDASQPVYSRPFRIVLDVVAAPSLAVLTPSDLQGRPMVLRGQIDYQACDDRLCYPPSVVPVRWIVRLDRSTP